MNKILRTVVALLALTTASIAHAQFVMYDEFNGSKLSSKRWVPGSVGPLGAVEYRRYLSQGELRMSLYGIGNRSTTTGSRVRLRNRIYMHPDAASGLKSFQMRARVDGVKVRGCTAPGADVTRARLFMDLLWFNDGRSSGPGDFTGDVFATLGLRQSTDEDPAAKILSVVGRVFRCEDAGCNDFQQLGSSVRLGEVAQGDVVDLTSNWDRNNALLKWAAKVPGKQVMSGSFDYLSFVSTPVASHNRDYAASIHLRTEIADCDVENSGSRAPFSTMNGAVLWVRTKRE